MIYKEMSLLYLQYYPSIRLGRLTKAIDNLI
jgi:hypothetical protein